ncbi:basic leucine zipper 61 [Sesamum indicum]|uniref:Basic leucine zipper 61 n=1 Tax=Sesamum indicum TaxID=4182 RepID=A0A6I9UP40_SESIN|nr:basic leucine zipper 61 [Sesamum indicum]
MAHLPPKVPSMTHNWPDFSHQKIEGLGIINNNPPSWVDEFLDFSSARRGSHRRSMSDSIAFLEPPMVEECRRSSAIMIPGDHHHHPHHEWRRQPPGPPRWWGGGGGHHDFDRFDDDQLMSMFTDDLVGGAGPTATMSCSNPSSPSDHNSINDDDKLQGLNSSDHLQQQQQQQVHPKSEPEEVQSSCKSEGVNGVHATTTDNSGEKIYDPKRIKRILANRQSAQRSRVRKLQYISELERSVTSLQAEVSVLSPRVAFLDHQRLVLNVDNSVLKQRIAALAQDKVFKDAHQEALKREIERLRQIYYQQNMKKMENGSGAQPNSPPRAADHTNCPAEKEQLAVN